MKETTKQAALRHRVAVATLYRRLARLAETGQVKIEPADYVAGSLYLDVSRWDDVCQYTRPPGRPRKS